jgi:hypothetical protein
MRIVSLSEFMNRRTNFSEASEDRAIVPDDGPVEVGQQRYLHHADIVGVQKAQGFQGKA